MRACLIALMFFAVSGCGKSINEMRAQGPKETFESAKSVEQVSKCLLFSWQDNSWYGSHFDVYLQPSLAGGNTVYANQNGVVADIDPSGGKTLVRYYQAGYDGALGRSFRERISHCL